MILLPAVDIFGGRAVRLDQGDYARSTDYSADPLDAAKRWVDEGARELHIVDLDGARAGEPANLDHVRRIAAAVDVPIQLGGGLRTIEATRLALAAGATSIREPADQFYGDRSAGVKDFCGNEWWMATHIEDVSQEEMERRMAAMAR